MKRNAAIVTVFVALVALSGAALLITPKCARAMPETPPATSYAGGASGFRVVGETAGEGEWVEAGTFKNDTGLTINDMVVGPKSGDGDGTNPPNIRGIEVEYWDESSGTWKSAGMDFDDNNDNQVGEGEDDNEGNAPSTGRGIGHGSQEGYGPVPPGAVFRVKVKVQTDEGTDFEWQATGIGEETGHGGPRLGAQKPKTKEEASWTESLRNNLPAVRAAFLLTNDDPVREMTGLTVEIEPGGEVNTVLSMSAEFPANWNAVTRTLTFVHRPLPGQSAVIWIDYTPGPGEETEFSGEALFME